MKTTFTLEEVQSAFKRLEAHAAAQGVDADCLWAIHFAAEDGVRILTGEWVPEGEEAAEDGLRRAALEARTEEAFDAAVVRMGLFDDRLGVAAARSHIDPAWRLRQPWPSPAGNEAMLAALEVYAQKRAGALGRGASRSEAATFARMEARRAFRQLSGE